MSSIEKETVESWKSLVTTLDDTFRHPMVIFFVVKQTLNGSLSPRWLVL